MGSEMCIRDRSTDRPHLHKNESPLPSNLSTCLPKFFLTYSTRLMPLSADSTTWKFCGFTARGGPRFVSLFWYTYRRGFFAGGDTCSWTCLGVSGELVLHFLLHSLSFLVLHNIVLTETSPKNVASRHDFFLHACVIGRQIFKDALLAYMRSIIVKPV